jgi:hypothetical protein
MRNIPTKIDGTSTLPAAEFNEIADELENAITTAGLTLASADVNQLAKAIASYSAISTFYTDSGVADAYVLTSVGSYKAPTAYTNGMAVRFKPGASNTGAATVNVAGLGVKNIKKADGTTDLDAGDLPASQDSLIIYDGTNFRVYVTTSVSTATQADMETATSTTAYVTPGRQQYHPSAAKAFVNFDGTATGTLRTTYNVSSVTDNGVGDYTINFTTSFSSVNYVGQISAGKETSGFSSQTPAPANAAVTASAFRFGVGNSAGTAVDWTHVMGVFYGDQ